MVPGQCISTRQGTGRHWSGEMELLGKGLEMMILWDFLNSSNSKNCLLTKSTRGQSLFMHLIIIILVWHSLIWMEWAFEQFLLYISPNHGKYFHWSLFFLLVLPNFLLLFPGTSSCLSPGICWTLRSDFTISYAACFPKLKASDFSTGSTAVLILFPSHLSAQPQHCFFF